MKKRLNQRRSSGRRQSGLQLVELAFVMPVMIVLLGATAEFGRYFQMRSTLLRSTMTGANYMSDKSNTAAEIQNAQRMTVCGQKTTTCAAAARIFPGFVEANVTVTIASATSTASGSTFVANYVTVQTTGINYRSAMRLNRMLGRVAVWDNIPIVVKTNMLYTGI